MKRIKRVMAWMLCLVLTLSLFGCGQTSEGDGQKDSGKNTKDMVYVPEYKDLRIDYLGTAVLEGQQMYYLLWNYDETTQVSSETLYCMDLNTLESTEIPFAKEENENIYSMAADGQGGLWMVMAIWNENTQQQTYYLQRIDSKGQQVCHQDVTAVLMEGQDPAFGVYPQDMCVDEEGNVYL
ncbi:MAG: hypothetical protein J6I64_09335, partial [Lachnospiraceae bacterium]|nr:hypothetical protein [Lachnospiraceae bacterium]